MTFNDLFLEFDVNTNNFQSFYDLTNEINTHNLESVSDEVFSPNAYQPLIEQYENQQSNIELLSSPPNHDSIDHHEVIPKGIILVYICFLYISLHRQVCPIIKTIKSLVQDKQ